MLFFSRVVVAVSRLVLHENFPLNHGTPTNTNTLLVDWLHSYLDNKTRAARAFQHSIPCVFFIFSPFFFFIFLFYYFPPATAVYTYFSHIFQFLSPFFLPIAANSRPSSSFSLFPIPQQKIKRMRCDDDDDDPSEAMRKVNESVLA